MAASAFANAIDAAGAPALLPARSCQRSERSAPAPARPPPPCAGRAADALQSALPTCRGPGPLGPSRRGARGVPSSSACSGARVGFISKSNRAYVSKNGYNRHSAPRHICGEHVRVAASVRRRAAEPGLDQGGGRHLRFRARGRFLQNHGRSHARCPRHQRPSPAHCLRAQPQAGRRRLLAQFPPAAVQHCAMPSLLLFGLAARPALR